MKPAASTRESQASNQSPDEDFPRDSAPEPATVRGEVNDEDALLEKEGDGGAAGRQRTPNKGGG